MKFGKIGKSGEATSKGGWKRNVVCFMDSDKKIVCEC